MKIVLDRVDDAFHFEAKNEDGKVVHMDGAADIGGNNAGVRPMQMIVMGLGGCSGIDVVLILKKQKQEIQEMKIELDAVRHDDRSPKTFKSIHVRFKFKGDLDPKKAKRAVALSMEKYCSVTKMLEATVDITFNAEVNGVLVD